MSRARSRGRVLKSCENDKEGFSYSKTPLVWKSATDGSVMPIRPEKQQSMEKSAGVEYIM